jgi:hypothetical protein
MNPIENKLGHYKENWLDNVQRMKDIRYPKELHDYQETTRRLKS